MDNGENKLFLTSNGYEYLEDYLTQIYGERGSFRHNLERYANSNGFLNHTHVINSIDDIQEITFQDLQNQVKREEHFKKVAHDLAQLYDELQRNDKLTNEAEYEVAGIMGFAPGVLNWNETLFPHLLDLFVSTEEEGITIKKELAKKPNIISLIVSAMMDGIRDHQLIRSDGLNIYSQGYTRNLWRGENAYNNHCYASMYRNRPLKEREAEIHDFVCTLRIAEFSLWLATLNFVQTWPYGSILHGAIAQHYGIPTNALDVSGDLKSSIFFACTVFDKNRNEFRPLDRKEYENVDSREKVAKRQGDSRYGILFQAPLDVINMSLMADDSLLHFTSARPIGYQPFMRCGNQNGYVIETGPGFDLYREPCFSVYKFRLTEEICDWGYSLMDDDDNVYPDEAFGSIEDVVKTANETKCFSETAFSKTMEHMSLTDKEDYLRKELFNMDIIIRPEIQLCSSERKQELEQQFEKNSQEYKKRLSGGSFRFGFCT